jgi:hypothetical protein
MLPCVPAGCQVSLLQASLKEKEMLVMHHASEGISHLYLYGGFAVIVIIFLAAIFYFTRIRKR